MIHELDQHPALAFMVAVEIRQLEIQSRRFFLNYVLRRRAAISAAASFESKEQRQQQGDQIARDRKTSAVVS